MNPRGKMDIQNLDCSFMLLPPIDNFSLIGLKNKSQFIQKCIDEIHTNMNRYINILFVIHNFYLDKHL